MSVVARNIGVEIGGRVLLRDVGLTARAGEVTAIVGPNGSGKTTLMRVLTGELVPDAGQVTLGGQPVGPGHAAQMATRRGVLPQASHLAFSFTVDEVVRIGQLAGLAAGDPGLGARALAAVGLAGFGPRRYQALSGGEQQRVQLARVLCQVWQPMRAGAANWLFLDEPVASLDIGHQLGIMQVARDYADGGGGVITVMHDLNLTAMFADRVMLLAGGAVMAEGTPGEVLCDEVLSAAYGCRLRLNTPPLGAVPYLLPQAAGAVG
ncbi:heme ABC transporter ATP-binding protein [Roseovarius sp. C7]|uniref:heme ABC transporter ATP-binding protein n=1 Tax=Roseovarius sp. C7 TaxID=3398643 RepID=UPI0039F70543